MKPKGDKKPLNQLSFEFAKVLKSETKAGKSTKEQPTKAKDEPYHFFLPLDCR